MNYIESAVFILFITILSVPLASRFRLPLEIFLVVGSCLISLIPGLPLFHVDPVVVFYLFLPPILFYAAYFTSWRDFKANFRPIALLAFGLVLFTAFLTAYAARFIFPELSWQEGFLLGAIISPTDASAATTIIKKIGAPKRLISILEGESLVNDATALLLFRFALAAIMSGTFSLPQATLQLFVISLGGVGVGLSIGILSLFIVRKLHDTPAETTLSFIAAFSCYFMGEHLKVSGVIATVVCGLFYGINFPEYTSSKTRLNSKVSWGTLLFIINGFAFALIGLQLPSILKSLQIYSPWSLVFSALSISLIVILIRLMWVFPVAHLSRFITKGFSHKTPKPAWQSLFVVGWSGMRGIVSLAAVLSLPHTLPSGAPFIHRELLIFITYSVIVVTLFLPTLTLPALLNFFQLSHSDETVNEEALARVRSLESALKRIDELVVTKATPVEIASEMRRQIERRLTVLRTHLDDTPHSTLDVDYMAIKKLSLLTLASERTTLIDLRRQGQISDETFHHLSDEVDLEVMRAGTLRI